MTKGPKFAIVIPTFNEAANVPILITRLESLLANREWEIIVVDDDSSDGTASLVRKVGAINPRVRVIQRVGRNGLSSACVEGMLATSASIVAVMDGDLQHDETVLPLMLDKLASQPSLDLVVATRHKGGSMGSFSKGRVALSNVGKRLAAFVCHSDVSDPMSGFFAVRVSFFYEVVHHLSQSGFKILVDMLASSRRPVVVEEVPYSFRERVRGESKLDSSTLTSYLYLLIEKALGSYIPIRFTLFCLVGLSGVILNLLVLTLGLRATLPFQSAQLLAVLAAMSWNYALNNAVTFGAMRRKGTTMLVGLLVWYAACSVGLYMNVVVASYFNSYHVSRQVASMLGLGVAAMWNYGINSILLWRHQGRSANERSRRQLELIKQSERTATA